MLMISLQQRYPGHVAQALALCAQCSAAANFTKWIIELSAAQFGGPPLVVLGNGVEPDGKCGHLATFDADAEKVVERIDPHRAERTATRRAACHHDSMSR